MLIRAVIFSPIGSTEQTFESLHQFPSYADAAHFFCQQAIEEFRAKTTDPRAIDIQSKNNGDGPLSSMAIDRRFITFNSHKD